MKANFIHVCFVVDESHSMLQDKSEITSGFQYVIDDQKINASGSCAVSLYKFHDTTITQEYIGKDVKEITGFGSYTPHGTSCLCDAVWKAITETSQWINGMTDSEKPEKTLFVVMTDGRDNSSSQKTLSEVRELISEKEEDYWKFVYIGANLKTMTRSDTEKATYTDYSTFMAAVSTAATEYRCISGDIAIKTARIDATLDFQEGQTGDTNLSEG